MVLLLDEALELVGVDEVAVVGETDAVRRVDVERLRLRDRRAAGRGVADVPEPDVAAELEHVPLLEHVAHEAVALAHAEAARVVRHDARRVLAAMLQHRERVVERLIHRVLPDDADESAHALRYPSERATAKHREPTPITPLRRLRT